MKNQDILDEEIVKQKTSDWSIPSRYCTHLERWRKQNFRFFQNRHDGKEKRTPIARIPCLGMLFSSCRQAVAYAEFLAAPDPNSALQQHAERWLLPAAHPRCAAADGRVQPKTGGNPWGNHVEIHGEIMGRYHSQWNKPLTENDVQPTWSWMSSKTSNQKMGYPGELTFCHGKSPCY